MKQYNLDRIVSYLISIERSIVRYMGPTEAQPRQIQDGDYRLPESGKCNYSRSRDTSNYAHMTQKRMPDFMLEVINP